MDPYLGHEFSDGNLLSDVLLWAICEADLPSDFPSRGGEIMKSGSKVQ
jgi:hypothetical protein